METHNLTLSALRDKIGNKEISAVEVVKAYKNRIEEQKDLNAVITTDFDNALCQAEKIDKDIAAGKPLLPLSGVPIILKDNISVKDVRMTCASKFLANYVPPFDATVTKRLKDAGAIIIAKSNMDEFAMGAKNTNSAFGAVKNPLDKTRVPGGSSGGSAACVAAGLCAAALGTDTGGSIRQPSAFCGVVGIKPTYGAVSRFGVTAFASSLDQVGPITKTAKDNAVMLGVIAGRDERDCTSLDSKSDYLSEKPRINGRKICVIKQIFSSPLLSEEVKFAFENQIKNLCSLGVEIEYADMPSFNAGIATYFAISTAEAASNLSRFDGIRYGVRANGKDVGEVIGNSRGRGFGPEVKKRIITGNMVLCGENYQKYYLKAMKMRARIRAELESVLSGCDFAITPTAPVTALPFDYKAENLYEEYYGDMFTVIANISGNPALSIPMKTGGILPAGLQLIGSRLDEKTLYSAAIAIEEAKL